MLRTGISNRVHGFDLDSGLLVARTFEELFEICYTAQLNSGWTLQPDFQYIVQPGGNVPNASRSGAVANAVGSLLSAECAEPPGGVILGGRGDRMGSTFGDTRRAVCFR
jgi:hypothetical protein